MTTVEISEESLGVVAFKVTVPGWGIFNFDENGHIVTYSGRPDWGFLDLAGERIRDIVPEVRARRRAFRQRIREETARAEADPVIPKPGKGHSENGRESPALRWKQAPGLVRAGYTTAWVWDAWCKYRGADQYDYLLWPPYVPPDKEYVAREVARVSDLADWPLIQTNTGDIHLPHLWQRTPQGTVYTGTLKTKYPGGMTREEGIRVIIKGE